MIDPEAFARRALRTIQRPPSKPIQAVDVSGVMWCTAHSGLIDECADRVDDDGEPCCDQWDRRLHHDDPCSTMPLYIEAAT